MATNNDNFNNIPDSKPSNDDTALENLAEALQAEKDARKEDRFIFIVIIVLLLDVVFFSVIPNLAGPIALLILELLILIPLAKKMGMQEMVEILDRVLHRMAGKSSHKDD